MPKRMSATAREAIMTEDRSKLDLKRSVWNDTGFVNVIKVGDKYQARLQVPGDGRGGTKKRRQHALPGLFDTRGGCSRHAGRDQAWLRERRRRQNALATEAEQAA